MDVAVRRRSRSAKRWNIVQAASASWVTGSNDAVAGVVGRREQHHRDAGRRGPVVERRGEGLAHAPFDRVRTQGAGGGVLGRQRYGRHDVADQRGQALDLPAGVEAEPGGVAEPTVLLADPGAVAR